MQLRRITRSEDKILDNLLLLYEDTFPESERRELNQLKELIDNEKKMLFFSIELDNITAGFFIYWDLDEFYFLEHFAINPELRNRKIGQKILDYMNNNLKGLRIMEVEPADEEIAVRRIKYYERNGYKIIEKNYLQPSYKDEDKCFPMWIMSNNVNNEKIEQHINKIKKEVYMK